MGSWTLVLGPLIKSKSKKEHLEHISVLALDDRVCSDKQGLEMLL